MPKASHVFLLCSLLSVPLLGSSPAHAFVFVTFSDKACLDVREGSTADGTPIQAFQCLATFPQQWSWDRFTIASGIGKCVDVLNSGTADGTPIQLYSCNGSGAQQWFYEDGAIKNLPSGKCLDVGNGEPFTQATIQTCNGSFGQRWTIRSAQLVKTSSKRCLSVTNEANGTRLQSDPCGAFSFQAWNWEGPKIQGLGTISERLGGKCVDIAGGRTADGTPVQLFDCNGTGAQQWRFSNGVIINPRRGKCLHVPNRAPFQAVITACTFAVGSDPWSIR